MAKWQKIITSGSKAELLELTASYIVVTGSGKIRAGEFELEPNSTNYIGVGTGGTGTNTFGSGELLTGNGANAVTTTVIGIAQNNVVKVSAVDATNGEYAKFTSTGLESKTTGELLTDIGLDADDTASFGALNIGAGSAVAGKVWGGSGNGLTSSPTTFTGSFTGSFSGDGTNITGIASSLVISGNSGAGDTIALKDEGLVITGSNGISTVMDASNTMSINLGADLTGVTSLKNDSLIVGRSGANDLISFTSGDIGFKIGNTEILDVTSTGVDIKGANVDLTVEGDISGSNLSASGDLEAGGHLQVNGIYSTGGGTGGDRTVSAHFKHDISASGFIGEYWDITDQVVVTSESSAFGNTDDDTHTFIGDIIVGSGSGAVDGTSLTGSIGGIINGISGSLGQYVDLRSAFGGVSGSSFTGSFVGDGAGLDLSGNTTIGSDIFKPIATEDGGDIVDSGNTDTLTLNGDNGVTVSGSISEDKINIGLSSVPDSALAQITNTDKVAGSAVQLSANSAIEDSTGLKLKDTLDGTGLTLDSSGGNQVLNVDAAQTQITSVGSLDGLTISTGNTLEVTDDGGLSINSTAVTSTAAELNLLDTSVAGTVVNDKAVIYASDGTVSASAFSVGGVKITSTPTELNQLDGYTGDVNDLNLLDTAVGNTVVNDKAVIYGSSGEVKAQTLSTVGAATIGGALTISGDLQVNGSTTTIDAAQLKIEDNAIHLNSGSADVAYDWDSGLSVERTNTTGSGFDNNKKAANIFWDESEQRWSVGLSSLTTTGTATDTGDVFDYNASSPTNRTFLATVSASTAAPSGVPVMGKLNQDKVGQIVCDANGDIWMYALENGDSVT